MWSTSTPLSPVGDDGARLPRAPQRAHDLHVFVGHVVAQVVLRHPRHAEIHRREVRAAGDGIPADAPGGDLIERGDQAGQQVGRVGVGAEGRHDADARGDGGHQGGDHRRVLARHGDAVLQVDLGGPAEAFADVGGVLDQHVVEAGAFQAARHVGEQLGHHPVAADMAGPGLAPGLDARALQEPAEVEGFGGHRPAPLAASARTRSRWVTLDAIDVPGVGGFWALRVVAAACGALLCWAEWRPYGQTRSHMSWGGKA